jgi:hypothetical protein
VSDDHSAQPDLRAIEFWFVERGVPHFVERKTDGSALDAWTRALPLLVVAYLLQGLNALNLAEWSFERNLSVAVAVITMLLAAWVLSNRLRGVPAFARPTDIDAPELALFLFVPAVPALLFEQTGDAIQSVLSAAVLLAAIYIWSSYGLGPLTRWGLRRGRNQLTGLGSLVARALPLLLLFNTFLFINAEVWEMAGTLNGWAYVVVILTFASLGVTFALSRVPGVIRAMRSFESWSDIDEDRLRLRQRFNIGLIVLFGQALQITLVTVALTGFFIGFGFFAITETTTLGWTRLDEVHALTDWSFGGRPLILSEPLLRVSVFLGSFSGMYFTVVLTTDDTYRTEFADDVGPEVREALAVRSAYRVARGTHPQSALATATPTPVPRASNDAAEEVQA